MLHLKMAAATWFQLSVALQERRPTFPDVLLKNKYKEVPAFLDICLLNIIKVKMFRVY